ncbi:MAG TPA: sialidase family protein, partial [Nevskiaceae bacterium]|nr:sialidase family protein [Nevskiaceae bacterium]
GGGGSAPASPPYQPPPVPTPVAPLTRISADSPFTTTCGQTGGTLYHNAEVEPWIAVNPSDATNLIAVWQQDRWSSGGAQGLLTGYSLDGGTTWSRTAPAFSACAGGSFPRASDPWITFSPNGTAFQIALVFSGDVRAAGSSSAMLVSRSRDGGASWDAPVSLTSGQEGASVFNDKESITADPNNTLDVYAVWDQLDSNTHGATWFSRTLDGGDSWGATPTMIFDPGAHNQTIGNQIVVLPAGDLLLFFTEIDGIGTNSSSARFRLLRSTDDGATWPAASAVTVMEELAVGARDPQTGALIRDAASLPQVKVSAAGDVYVVAQDARFSGGQRDGIIVTVSHDGGLNWSSPVQLNGEPAVQAFVPSVAVRASDGLIGVTYYDLRHNTSDPSTLLTDYWLALSSDGVSWNDNFLAGPFDLDLAPQANGLFVGDYQSLALQGEAFVPVFVQTTAAAGDPTDVYEASYAPAAVMEKSRAQLRPMLAQAPAVSADFRARVQENLENLAGETRQPPR